MRTEQYHDARRFHLLYVLTEAQLSEIVQFNTDDSWRFVPDLVHGSDGKVANALIYADVSFTSA